MKNFCILFVLFLNQIALVVSYYNATDVILFDCGNTQSDDALDGRNWAADLRSKFGPVDESDNKSIAARALYQGTSTVSVPYMTARISRSQFSYNFPVTSGQKFVRLHFHPTNYTGGFQKYKDWFGVRVGPYTFLRNFSASLFADDWNVETFFREFCVNVADEQSLNISFAPFFSDSNDSYVFINGIEIMSMPSNLYYTAPDDVQGIQFVGQNRTFRVQNHTALGTVRRLNVGGGFIQPEDDTGIYRSWKDDYVDLDSLSVVSSNPGVNLNYSKIPQYVAPDDVYLSSRFMGVGTTDNLTWGVLVYPGYSYLVRLHFCEYFSSVEVNERRFDIFIDNKTAEIGLDIVEATGGSFVPIYKDYLVMAGNKGETQDYMLNISIRPNRASLNPDGFLNGMEIIRLNDSDGNLAGPNRESTDLSPEPAVAPAQPLPPTNKSSSKRTLLIVAITGSVLVSLIIFVLFWGLNKRKKHAPYSRLFSCCGRQLSSQKGRSARSKASSLPQELCRNFFIDEIRAATNNFDKSLIIGEGGFGYVYEGKIDDGTTMVAIKRLNQDSKQGVHEFKTEIEMLSQLRHLHLVSLIGYCTDEGEMILIYDYMMNGTLREHLYDTSNDPLLWKQRLEICIGAARGLDYLHTGARHTIIHRDIKTTNILLDENWIAKVSDFGLSRISDNDTMVSTIVKGTFGYLDPEYAQRKQLTEKSDVYSFGVVLFEVLCARKPVDKKLEEPVKMSLALWARKCIQNGTIHQIIDPYLMGKISPNCFNIFVHIAESCIRDHGTDRPSMHDVKEKLEFALELQEAADADQKKGTDPVYPHVSFCAPRYTNLVAGSNLNGFESSSVDTSYNSGITNSLSFKSDTLSSTDASKSATT